MREFAQTANNRDKQESMIMITIILVRSCYAIEKLTTLISYLSLSNIQFVWLLVIRMSLSLLVAWYMAAFKLMIMMS